VAAVAAPRSRRRGRLRYAAERRGVLATLLISPAVLFIGALVGFPLGLAVYLSLTDATAGSLSGPWVGLANFRQELRDPIFRDAVWHTFLFTAISQAVVIVCAGLLAHALVGSCASSSCCRGRRRSR
jgi:multiple sugar transport system permease protein